MTGRTDTRRTAVDLLDDVAAGMRTRAEAVLRSHGLSYDAWRVLQSLAADGPQPMRQLRESTRITGPTLTRVVDRLAETALVYRNVDAADRRRVVVHLSDRGRAVHETLRPDLARLEQEALAPLSADEAALLEELLERIVPGG
ncbi:MarR family transcriptional regulator [uncultured Georgenia sp.]|uniref:MarR family winged helix-turn-helix transcriptional regulator n=1 Tax=uncultured Georgenia sp. TaxID=378209 RepID=UPI0026349112|nr:MarR family transcriptional regulator [uncultured Georgenia sp.]HLV05887.1 MarR family transcriptional regulator [Actinomycetaceae bacterium]